MAEITRSDQSEQTDLETKKKDDDAPSEARREALKHLGMLAAYTAPAMLAMLTETKAQICSIC